MLGKLVNWIDERIPMTATYNKHVGQYPAPKNFNFWYFFGSLAMLVLVNQLLTGVVDHELQPVRGRCLRVCRIHNA